MNKKIENIIYGVCIGILSIAFVFYLLQRDWLFAFISFIFLMSDIVMIGQQRSIEYLKKVLVDIFDVKQGKFQKVGTRTSKKTRKITHLFAIAISDKDLKGKKNESKN